MNTTIAADRSDFRSLLAFQNPNSFLFEGQEAIMNDPSEKIQKIRRLNPPSCDSLNSRNSNNFASKAEPAVFSEESPLLKPQKVVVKSLSSNPASPENISSRYNAMMIRDNNKRKQHFSFEEHQAQLERMRSLGSHQAKALENYMASRKSSSLSTMNGSPCNSLRGSFQCALSPKNEEDIKASLSEIVNTRFSPEGKCNKGSQKLNYFDDLAPLHEALEQPNLMLPMNQESEAHMNLRRAVSLPQQGSMEELEENTCFNSPTLSYQSQHGSSIKRMMPFANQMMSPILGSPDMRQSGQQDFRSLADLQMKTIQSLVLNKRSNSQMDYTLNSNSLNNKNGTQEQSQSRSCLEVKKGFTQSPNTVDQAMLERLQFQRMMQCRFAMQQRSYLMMQQKMLSQKNTELKSNRETTSTNTMETSPLRAQDVTRVSNSLDTETNASDNIDKFFTSCTSNNEDQPISSLENIGNYQTSYKEKDFFETDHFLNSFTESSNSIIKQDNNHFGSQSLKNVFLSEELF